MADLLFANNPSALLNTSITDSDLTIELASGFGTLFPSPSGTEYFLAALEDDQGNYEIVRCTSRAGDILTVLRGQDNTSPQSFTQNVTRVELRLTAAVMEEFLQVNGGVMAGDIDMAANSILDAVLSGPATQITAGEIVGVPIRGTSGVSLNEIAISGSSAPTIGGSAILKAGDDLVAELDTAGVIILDSATVGVRIPSSGYLRVEGSTAGDYIQLSHDDTDANLIVAGAADLNILSLTGDVVLGAGIDLDANDNQVIRAEMIDFAFTEQAVSASTTTDIDYTAGSYVALTMDQSITNLNITNPPASQYGAVRLKITQDGTGNRTVANWPSGILWPGGSEPVLSTSPNAVDFIDLWTDNGGSTWYGAFGLNWS